MEDITFTTVIKKLDGTTAECTATISNNEVTFEVPEEQQEEE